MVLLPLQIKFAVNNKIKQNKQLAETLHKPIIPQFKKRKVFLLLKTIFGVLAWLICN